MSWPARAGYSVDVALRYARRFSRCATVKAIKVATGAGVTPALSLAIRKAA